ncbi:ABC transporter substrate-binding protein [Planctomycetaceae bacterium SCGC AG-212-D15]|nr:ABC transporter substrate-binding protein [Planctomycetaceae bacterium SCGC AG-212-D15]
MPVMVRGLFSCVLVCLLVHSVQADEIVLGVSAAFKGPSRGLGTELYRGSLAYFEHVNTSGGVVGKQIVLKAYDDSYNPGPAVENTVRLIEQDRVHLLYGYVGTPTVTRVLPLLKIHSDTSMCMFFPFTGAEPQRQAPYDQYVFNLRASYGQETAGLVDNFVKIGRKRIGLFYQCDAYGRSGWHGVRVALAKHDLRMVGEATYRRGSPFSQDMHAQVEILRKAGADAVIAVGAYAACAAFVRDARDAGWDVPIANISFVGSESLLTLLTEHGSKKGRDYTVNLLNSQVVPSYHDTTLPAIRQYREMMAKYKPLPPAQYRDDDYRSPEHSFVSLEGFLNAKLLVEILKKGNASTNRRELRKAAESMEGIDLGIGEPITFGPNRHQALNRVYFTVVNEGRFVPLSDWERWSK